MLQLYLTIWLCHKLPQQNYSSHSSPHLTLQHHLTATHHHWSIPHLCHSKDGRNSSSSDTSACASSFIHILPPSSPPEGSNSRQHTLASYYCTSLQGIERFFDDNNAAGNLQGYDLVIPTSISLDNQVCCTYFKFIYSMKYILTKISKCVKPKIVLKCRL